MEQFDQGFSQRESDQEEHHQFQNRPSSVKASEANQKKLGRPESAKPIKRFNNFMNNNLVPIRKRKGYKIKSYFDKERLVDETIQIKKQLNTYKEENVKLKTKINQLEKQMLKQEGIIDNINKNQVEPISNNHLKKLYLEKSLKNTIKNLKKEITTKQEELDKAKKNIKQTRILELEVEIQSYKAECTRLRHLLEETFRGRLGLVPNSNEEDAEALRERNYQQNQIIKNLKTQTQEMQNVIKQKDDSMQETNKKLKQLEMSQTKAAKRQFEHKQKEEKRQKERIKELEKQLEASNKSLSQLQIRLQESKKKEEKVSQAKELEDKNSKQEQSIQSLNQQIFNLRETIHKNSDKFESEKQRFNQQIENLKSQNQKFEKQNQTLIENIKQQEEQINQLKSQKIEAKDVQIKAEYKESAKQLVKQTQQQKSIRMEESPLVEQASRYSESPIKRKPEDILILLRDHLSKQHIGPKQWWQTFINKQEAGMQDFNNALIELDRDFTTDEIQDFCDMLNSINPNRVTYLQFKYA